MSALTTRVRAIPRTLIDTTLTAARLPLMTLERVTGQQGNAEWPPAMAFEAAEATVETVLGGLLRDDDLVSRGRLRQTRLAKLREATELETVAEQRRRQAATELQERREETERRREQVEQAAEQREQEVERQAQQRKAAVERQASARKQSVRKQAAHAEQAVERVERTAKLQAADAQAQALEAERAALEAEDTAVAVDETLDGQREARRSG
jgi:hypothetical protein